MPTGNRIKHKSELRLDQQRELRYQIVYREIPDELTPILSTPALSLSFLMTVDTCMCLDSEQQLDDSMPSSIPQLLSAPLLSGSQQFGWKWPRQQSVQAVDNVSYWHDPFWPTSNRIARQRCTMTFTCSVSIVPCIERSSSRACVLNHSTPKVLMLVRRITVLAMDEGHWHYHLDWSREQLWLLCRRRCCGSGQLFHTV